MKKELEMGIRNKMSKKIAERYQRARKKEKGKILDEFVSLMGYNRNYASWLLRNICRRCHQAGYNAPPIGTHNAPGLIGRKRL